MSNRIIPTVYLPTYFKLYELVHFNTYQKYDKLKKLHYLWGCLDNRMLWTLDMMRERYGSITINNWYQKNGIVNPNGFKSCGLRDMDDNVGAELSQHKFGRAFDLHPGAISAQAIIAEMDAMGLFKDGTWRESDDPKFKPFLHITTIERSCKGIPCTWLHIDNRTYTYGTGAIVVLDV